MRIRLFNIIVLITSCLLLSSCSLRWSYNLLDWLVAWEVSEYVSLNREQKKQLNKSVDDFQRWHRKTQLPLYADFLQHLESQLLDEETDSEALMGSFDQASVLWQNSLLEFTAFAPTLFRELNEDQIQELIKNTEKETNKAAEKYMGREEDQARQKQHKHMRKRLNKWLGKLTPEQNILLQQWSVKVTTNHKLMVKARQEWQQRFDDTLKNDRNSEDFEQQVQVLLVYPNTLWSDEYQQSVKHNQQLTMQLFADISHRLTGEQKRKLRKKLRGYISDFRYLAKK